MTHANLTPNVGHAHTSATTYQAVPDVVAATRLGQRHGATGIDTVQSQYCDPDELFFQLRPMLPSIRDVEILSVIRGFLRPIQKELQREQK